MKKLNIKDIKNGMSRNEMREIKGGSGFPCFVITGFVVT